MGWAGPGTGETPAADAADPAPAADASAEAPPWRAELAALEEQLRGALAAQQTGVTANERAPVGIGPAPAGGDDLLRQVQALMAESEHRQRQEFASGLMRLAQEVDLHRQADRLRMQQEVDSLADYMVRVAQR
jgi:hypothetical protein